MWHFFTVPKHPNPGQNNFLLKIDKKIQCIINTKNSLIMKIKNHHN